jgi:hypothetical protein
MRPDATQEHLDQFYFRHGPCCAGCDWWRHISSLVGDCTRSAPVSGDERMSMLGISNCSLPFDAGHVITEREHVCGDFKDEFDWTSLPPPYRKRVGAPI